MYNSYASHADLTIPIAYVLLLLSSKKGTLSTQIAPLLGMEAGSITRLLKSMEQQNLISRKADQTDKRQVSVYLTDYGIGKRTEAQKIVTVFNDMVKEKIAPKNLNIFLSVLQEIVEIAENNHHKE
jgi:DNA-binding MarR family transcriptional regulator